MINEEELIFNDADGSDKDINAYDYMGFRDHSENKNWDDPMFFSSCNDYCISITYDCIKENIRYHVTINYEMTGTNEKYVSILYGNAYSDYSNSPEQKKITMIGAQYGTGYFVNYINNEVDPSSSKKFVKIIKQILDLKAFL